MQFGISETFRIVGRIARKIDLLSAKIEQKTDRQRSKTSVIALYGFGFYPSEIENVAFLYKGDPSVRNPEPLAFRFTIGGKKRLGPAAL